MKSFLAKFFDIKFWKFLLVGVLNTLIGEGVVLLMLHAFGWKQVSYFLNKYFTFKNKEKGWKPVIRFTANIAVCMLVRVVVATLVSEGCKAANLSMFSMSVNDFAANMSWAVGACVFVACNYVGQRFFAFREKSEEE